MEHYSKLNTQEAWSVVQRYLKSNTYNYALLIDGPWGGGKTHFVTKELIPKIQENENEKKPIYVSLYGLRSTDELMGKVSQKVIFKKSEKRASTAVKIAKECTETIRSFTKVGLNLDGILLAIASFTQWSKYILIFDDLERCQIDIQEVLGAINGFVEHEGCKVILIANQKELGNQISKNQELKYLVAAQKNIVMTKTEEVVDPFLKGFYHEDKQVEVEEENFREARLRKRATLLFSKNHEYEKIKEKLIGEVIYFSPVYNEILEALINGVRPEKTSKILLAELSVIEEIFHTYAKCNLRTFQAFLEKTIYLFDLIDKAFEDRLPEIGAILIKYIFRVVCGFRNNETLSAMQAADLIGNFVIGDGGDGKNYLYGFKFVDCAVVNGYVGCEMVTESIKQYLTVYDSMLKDPNDPYNLLDKGWSEAREEEVTQNLSTMVEKLEADKYDFECVGLILELVIAITVGAEMPPEFMDRTKKYVLEYIAKAETPLAWIKKDTHRFMRSNKVCEKIETVSEEIEKAIVTQNEKVALNSFSSILDGKDWGNKLKEYFDNNKFNQKFKPWLLFEMQGDELNDLILNSYAGEISKLRECVYNALQGSAKLNIAELHRAKEVMEKMRSELKRRIDEARDRIAQMQIRLLKDQLKENADALARIITNTQNGS